MFSEIKKVFLLIFILIHGYSPAQESSSIPTFNLALQNNGRGAKLQGYFVYKYLALGGGVTSYTINRGLNQYAHPPEDLGKSYFFSGGFDYKPFKRISFTLLSGVSFTQYQRAENITVNPPVTIFNLTSSGNYIYDLIIYNLVGTHINTSVNFNFAKYVSVQLGLNKEFHKFKNPAKFMLGIKLNLPLKD